MTYTYKVEIMNKFHKMTYNQFCLEYVAANSKTKRFSQEEIEWALYEASYKYFGSYEFTDQQSMAMDILEWAAKEYLKNA